MPLSYTHERATHDTPPYTTVLATCDACGKQEIVASAQGHGGELREGWHEGSPYECDHCEDKAVDKIDELLRANRQANKVLDAIAATQREAAANVQAIASEIARLIYDSPAAREYVQRLENDARLTSGILASALALYE
jgi:hypothetical protein